ncbi:Carboxypeptidase C (cathepsin A) [Rhizobiales bacterium GAS191]|nr:Carboxypeptidase C (cathepsin A) [Rhizobiales bacterium GAS191]
MALSFGVTCRIGLAASAMLLALSLMALAQESQPVATPPASSSAAPAAPAGERPEGRAAPGRAAAAGASQAAELHRLPPDSTTKQTLVLPDRTLSFQATAGSIRLYDGKGDPQADIAYTAYQLDGATAASRPVTFVFNGGPGSASAWLQLGAAGPWRVAMSPEAAYPSAPPTLIANAETWLDFTDLVFIDPAGTGYSRFVASGDDVRKRFYSVAGDITANAVLIRRWLEQAGRMASPKYLLGESYGGIRGPRVVWNLQTRQGVGINGLILVSPVLDFREFQGSSLLQNVGRLPTMAAVARDAKGPVARADMQDVERYAATDYLLDLMKGRGDTEALERMSDKVASLTGLDRTLVRRLAAQIPAAAFRRELDQRQGKVTSAYDATQKGYDPFPNDYTSDFEDPLTDALTAPVTSAIIDLYQHRLNWKPDGHYELLSDTVNGAWDWGRGISPPESLTDLRQALALDPKLKVIVAHGLFDLVTPYFGSKLALDQLPVYGSADRVRLFVYPGGHMFYTRDASRADLRSEAKAMISGK